MTAPDPIEVARIATGCLEDTLLSNTYRVAPESFWTVALISGDTGYDVMQPARAHGWQAVSGWGLDGWDLGSWPYVVIYHRDHRDAWDIAEYVEGDLTVYRYPTRELRDAATDCLAFWHWKHQDESWVADVDSVDVAPDRLRGPFSWKRLDASKEAS